MQESFSFTGMPRLLFGPGQFTALAQQASLFGRIALVVTGAASFEHSGRLAALSADFETHGLIMHRCQVRGEPSPEVVDDIVAAFADKNIALVVAIGGGSVLDAGKAVAAMLVEKGPVFDFLEGVGTRRPSGQTLPLIAVPTTSGTGSEATKNAVISRPGEHGFKKSLRHDRYIPALAVIDPELTVSAPLSVTAACGMDALSQLIESFLSTGASPLTDALATDGLRRMIPALPKVCGPGADDPACRGEVAYGAFLSGVTLAHAGLGVIHGVAGPMGGMIAIPHGVACANLLPGLLAATVRNLSSTDSKTRRIALAKLASLGRLFGGHYRDPLDCVDHLVASLCDWLERFEIPRLGTFGLTGAQVERLVATASNKNNPVALSGDQIRKVIETRW